jgi:hypothetical protein
MRRASHFEQNKWFYAAIAAFAVFFFWTEIRPVYLYRRCAVEASVDARTLLASKAAIATGDKAAQYQSLIDRNMYLRSDYESFLQKCLLVHGLPMVKMPEEE